MTDQTIKAVQHLAPFVSDAQCCAAFSMMEAFCPELREPTLLLRIAQLCSARAERTEPLARAAVTSLAFVLNDLRVGRLTGDIQRGSPYTVAIVTGQQNKTPT